MTKLGLFYVKLQYGKLLLVVFILIGYNWLSKLFKSMIFEGLNSEKQSVKMSNFGYFNILGKLVSSEDHMFECKCVSDF